MGYLEGKTALITGGGAGIGRAIVERFIAEGASVGVLDLSEERLASLKENYGQQMVTIQGDVRNYTDNLRAVREVVETFGALDSFVANAGIFDGFAKVANLPPEVLDEALTEVFDVNVKGYLYGARVSIPELVKTKGNMIFSLSGASFYPDGGGVLYTASKHAGLGLVRQLAYELAPDVRVNAVAPGGTVSELVVAKSLRPHCYIPAREERSEKIKQRNPLRMVMSPEDHVASYVLLASDQAQAITGEVISSDGGLGVRGLS